MGLSEATTADAVDYELPPGSIQKKGMVVTGIDTVVN